MRIFTVGHGRRTAEELVAVLVEAGARTVIDVRRFPGSRRNPQFNQARLARSMNEAGIAYLHAAELGGRLTGERGEELFDCIREPAFRSYAARMRTPKWQRALDDTLTHAASAFLCAETPWRRCHRRFIADLLAVRGHEVVHLVRPGESEAHPLSLDAGARAGKLYLCGVEVALNREQSDHPER